LQPLYFYQNVRGLRTKLFNVTSFFPSFISYDIIVFTETWFSPDISSSELSFDGFLVFWQDRNSSIFSRGGGVLIAVKTYLEPTAIPLKILDTEQSFVTLTFDSFIVLFSAVSLPPNAPISVFESHTSSVEQLISSLNPSYTLFCGDYNIPQVS